MVKLRYREVKTRENTEIMLELKSVWNEQGDCVFCYASDPFKKNPKWYQN